MQFLYFLSGYKFKSRRRYFQKGQGRMLRHIHAERAAQQTSSCQSNVGAALRQDPVRHDDQHDRRRHTSGRNRGRPPDADGKDAIRVHVSLQRAPERLRLLFESRRRYVHNCGKFEIFAFSLQRQPADVHGGPVRPFCSQRVHERWRRLRAEQRGPEKVG